MSLSENCLETLVAANMASPGAGTAKTGGKPSRIYIFSDHLTYHRV